MVFPRRSLRLPITLGVTMILLVVLVTVGWVLLAVFGAMSDDRSASFYWALLTVGTTLLVLILAGVVIYLALSIKAINLNRRQSNFIDSVTHELKSPIASLKLYLQTLNRRQVSPEQQASFYRFMLDDVERLDTLINHVLDAARLERDGAAAPPEEIDLPEVVQACAETVCLRYHVPRETIEMDLPACRVRATRVDLEIIVRNLIDNAVKYAGSPPRVEVRLVPEDSLVAILVRDNGHGIPQDLRRKIFGRFVRLGLELERTKPGTGLGLYLVRTLVRRHGGRVLVRDPDDGQGTIFEVRLPGWPVPAPQSRPLPVGG
jgi:two-component system, OmpR family, phosphate regulon sensor histidine kinase PhoR